MHEGVQSVAAFRISLLACLLLYFLLLSCTVTSLALSLTWTRADLKAKLGLGMQLDTSPLTPTLLLPHLLPLPPEPACAGKGHMNHHREDAKIDN